MEWSNVRLGFKRVTGPSVQPVALFPSNPNRIWFSHCLIGGGSYPTYWNSNTESLDIPDTIRNSNVFRGSGKWTQTFGVFHYNDIGPLIQAPIWTGLATPDTVIATECSNCESNFTGAEFGPREPNKSYRITQWNIVDAGIPVQVLPSNPTREVLTFNFFLSGFFWARFGPSPANLTYIGRYGQSNRQQIRYYDLGPIIREPLWIQVIPPVTMLSGFIAETYTL